jgi:dUTP pyrophosphatase
MKIQVLNPLIKIPARGSEHAAGYDVFMPSSGVMQPNGTMKVKLGFCTEIPVGYAAQMLPRSSFGAKGLVLANTVGLIDADYRGEWMVVLHNRSDHPLEWTHDERLVQFILIPVITPELEVVESLSDTARGKGGFGSTDK